MKQIAFVCLIALLTACSEQPGSPVDTPRPGQDTPEAPGQTGDPDPAEPDAPSTPELPDVTPTHTKGIYIHDFVRTDVDIDIFETDGKYTYAVSNADFERYITVSTGGTVSIADGGGIQSFPTAEAWQRQQGMWPDPVLSTTGSVVDGGAMICFGYVGSDGKATIDYLLLADTGEWADIGEVTFTDAWVLPVVTFKAIKYNPAAHPWRVWMQRNTSAPGIYRIIDLYRGQCPLADANAATAGDIIILDATDAKAVKLGPSPTAFFNPDIDPVYVGGNGRIDGRSIIFDTDFGQATLTLAE